MPDSQALTLAFMRTHPAQAARVLEGLKPGVAAELFDRTPARLGAGVLAAMLPRRGALVLDELDDDRALALLSPMPTQPAVTLLRHLAEDRRRRLIIGLPTAAAMASSLLLGYTDDTVGAWADPDVVLLPADLRAGEALERLRQAPGIRTYERSTFDRGSDAAAAAEQASVDARTYAQIFVADADRRLSGIVSLPALLRAPPGATLATLMQAPAATLPAVTPLAAAASHPGWEFASLLPVVEHGQRLIGLMTRDALTRALRQATAAPLDAAPLSLPGFLALGYWQSISGLLHGVLAVLPRVRPVYPTPVEQTQVVVVSPPQQAAP